MFTLVIGGSASGKSDYAERHVLSLKGGGPRIYIATMEPFGEEAQARIARHHAMRRDRGFETIECYRNAGALLLPENSNVLLEDLGNLAANELFGTEPAQTEISTDLYTDEAGKLPATEPAQTEKSTDLYTDEAGKLPAIEPVQTEKSTDLYTDEAGKLSGTEPAQEVARADRSLDNVCTVLLNKIAADIDSLRAQCSHLTIVTNEVFSGGKEYGGETLTYLRLLAALNRELAARADLVVEVVCGLPDVLKGQETGK